jgi:hypothetical protein
VERWEEEEVKEIPLSSKTKNLIQDSEVNEKMYTQFLTPTKQ